MPGNKWGPHDFERSKDKFSGTKILDQVPEISNNSHIPEDWMKNFLNSSEENYADDFSEVDKFGQNETLGTKFPEEHSFEQEEEVTKDYFWSETESDDFRQDEPNPGNGIHPEQDKFPSADYDTFEAKNSSNVKRYPDDFDDVSDANNDATTNDDDVGHSHRLRIDDLQEKLLRVLNDLSNKYNST